MINVAYDEEPHSTHRMSKWQSTIVMGPSKDTFGKERRCLGCGLIELLGGGAGSRWQEEDLSRKCEYYDRV
jgi:hypothetical protein